MRVQRKIFKGMAYYTPRTAGITHDEIKSVLDIGLFIKSRAASQVARIAKGVRNTVSFDVGSVITGEGGGEEDPENTETVLLKQNATTVEDNCSCGGNC